ncbi:DUF5009 domain-containing protein [Pelagicoccus sp. SDUM812003]|uniref:heparan-alpha-glucosaminide N-acetyltransferase domain-containing protein n=1 Tax=Pelagicoccus sp. SDUM812003 TaxID=3041267 RepID=UPI00280F61E7|nr:DUF5009 domain-containing protein [Pelagicoccus sp. SDUM812003]MDQ8202608.1 DUF5009 domain-containing protein [Pelagicoccus sp. SDUM812003]
MTSTFRIQSIDALRAITMLLMIWVNDFWTLSAVPHWLEHMPADVDALGFSDVIFPAFLFIVGLSIPFAIDQRKRKGESQTSIARHIASRSAALLVMGILMVNLDSYHAPSAPLPKPLWQVLMTIGFFLIWNVYPKRGLGQKTILGLKAGGLLLLAFLAATFRSDPENGYNWLEPHWWGILGLIGWSYLLAAFLYLLSGGKTVWVATGWAFLSLLNIAAFAGMLESAALVRDHVWIITDGALPALTTAGVLVSTLYLQVLQKRGSAAFIGFLVTFGVLALVAGLAFRPFWGISKILGTPAWTQICTGITALAFAFMYWLMDTKNISAWYRWIRPAGVATLTCYLVPYLVYPISHWLGIELPDSLTHGAIGLLKSFFFALMIIAITGLINRAGVKLKI